MVRHFSMSTHLNQHRIVDRSLAFVVRAVFLPKIRKFTGGNGIAVENSESH